MFAGRLPVHVMQLNPNRLHDEEAPDPRFGFLPQKLKHAGYVTAVIGTTRAYRHS